MPPCSTAVLTNGSSGNVALLLPHAPVALGATDTVVLLALVIALLTGSSVTALSLVCVIFGWGLAYPTLFAFVQSCSLFSSFILASSFEVIHALSRENDEINPAQGGLEFSTLMWKYVTGGLAQ